MRQATVQDDSISDHKDQKGAKLGQTLQMMIMMMAVMMMKMGQTSTRKSWE
jgi:hypothetical protein